MKGYCRWCGAYKKFLMADGSCPVCNESQDYLEHLARIGRIERREARKIIKGHRAPVMPYEAD